MKHPNETYQSMFQKMELTVEIDNGSVRGKIGIQCRGTINITGYGIWLIVHPFQVIIDPRYQFSICLLLWNIILHGIM